MDYQDVDRGVLHLYDKREGDSFSLGYRVPSGKGINESPREYVLNHTNKR
jgi:hypothetical protein